VVTSDLRLNTPRFVSLPNIMKARSKPLQRTTAAELGVDLSPRLTTLKVDAPQGRKAGVMLASVAELIDRLRNEAKVLP
jgi:electron transfer flavoprotein beta subunit